MSSKDCALRLVTKQGCILNCFGIQPVFVRDGKIDESFYAFVYRVGNIKTPQGRMHKLYKYRLGEENDVILKNAFHYKDADRVVVNFLLNQRTFTFKQNASLDELLLPQNHEKLKELMQLHLTRIQYYTMMCKGNFIITSRKELYNRRLFVANEVRNFEMYLVDESILPRNVLILGHKNTNSYRSPYVASPLIDQNHFDKLCKLNDIDLSYIFDEIDPKEQYPLIRKQGELYSLYQSYLDNVEIPYWYIEDFKDPVKTRQKAYYTTLFFD